MSSVNYSLAFRHVRNATVNEYQFARSAEKLFYRSISDAFSKTILIEIYFCAVTKTTTKAETPHITIIHLLNKNGFIHENACILRLNRFIREFLADRTNGRAIGTLFCLSVCLSFCLSVVSL